MSAISQFSEWYARLQGGVTTALEGPLQDGLKRKIKQKAKVNVYDAYASSGPRRGQIGGPENLEGQVAGMTLTVTNITTPQGTGAGMSEPSFVESGAANYRQPFARPFMDEARDEYAAGEAKEDLADALRSMGFTVV